MFTWNLAGSISLVGNCALYADHCKYYLIKIEFHGFNTELHLLFSCFFSFFLFATVSNRMCQDVKYTSTGCIGESNLACKFTTLADFMCDTLLISFQGLMVLLHVLLG